MAKYTILFKEYLETGGTLPASFVKLAGLFGDLDFTAAFKTRNLLKEIGQETTGAFYNRLDAKAQAMYPRVKHEIDLITTAPKGRNRSEVTSQDLTGTVKTTLDKGAVDQLTNRYSHPVSVTELNNTETTDGEHVKTTSGQDVQHSDTKNGGTITRTYTEETVDTALSYAELVERYGDLFERTLGKFDTLFLGVW